MKIVVLLYDAPWTQRQNSLSWCSWSCLALLLLILLIIYLISVYDLIKIYNFTNVVIFLYMPQVEHVFYMLVLFSHALCYCGMAISNEPLNWYPF